MSSFTFVIPLNRDDLLKREICDQYSVQNVVTIRELPGKLQDCQDAFASEGCSYILEHFDTLYSVATHSQNLDIDQILRVLRLIVKGLYLMNEVLPNILEDEIMPDLQSKMLNVLKMNVYILSDIFHALETKSSEKAFFQMKGKKNKDELCWDEDKSAALFVLFNILQHPLQKLWDPPIVDEDFVNLAANICYKSLEVTTISSSKMKPMRETIFQIIGTLIVNYQHTLSSVVRVVQLLKIYEHLHAALAEGVILLVQDFGCRSFLREIIREIGESESMFDQTGPKAFSAFLCEVAKNASDLVLPVMGMLSPYLECDAYMMRNCVLEVMGDIVVQSLSGENMDDAKKETRDLFLDQIMEHLLDVNAHVRAKALKVWQNLAREHAIPISRWGILLEDVIERLKDVSWTVVRSAVQLVLAFLEKNPFGALLTETVLRKKLESEEVLLRELEEKVKTPPDLSLLNRRDRWEFLLPELTLAVETLLSKNIASESDKVTQRQIDETEMTSILCEIRKFIDEKDFVHAFSKLRQVENLLPGAAEKRKDNKLHWQVDYFVRIIKLIYVEMCDETDKSAGGENKENLENSEKQKTKKQKTLFNGESNASPLEKLAEDKSLLQAQEKRVHFLRESLLFTTLMTKAVELVAQLLHTDQGPVIQDAVAFLSAAKLFEVEGAENNAKQMLMLLWSCEANIKTAIADSFMQMYLKTQSNVPGGRARAVEIIRNLCGLLEKLDQNEQAALEILVKEWVVSNVIDSACLQVMWERFTLTLNDTTPGESKGALALLTMASAARRQILLTNLDTLITVGFGERGQQDLDLVRLTCRALLKIQQDNGPASNEEPFRFPPDHPIFTSLCNILTSKFTILKEKKFIPMTEEAIDVIYELSEKPDSICGDLLKELCTLVKENAHQKNDENILNSPESSNLTFLSSDLLKRLVFMIGHVAFRQWFHLDRTIFRELKRRNRLREEYREKNKTAKALSKNKAKNLNVTGSSILHSSHASLLQLKKGDKDTSTVQDDDPLGEVVADDEDAEYINRICETGIVTDGGLLAKLSPIVVTVCENPHKYSDAALKRAACLALSKIMLVSSQFCESHLQLVFTMLEKSPEPEIRSGLVFAIGDLVNRFPSLLDPWTKNIYSRLRDTSGKVRQDTILVLKHLIMNEMVKVRGQISELALCIIDTETNIAAMASSLFQELSKKGNTLYNVMPDIISRLSNPEIQLSEENFQKIMRYLMGLINKDRQLEQLVDKICQRFRASNSDRQTSDLAFCLTLMEYSDRSLRRLLENFPNYAHKLTVAGLYDALNTIGTAVKKTQKAERISVIEELDAKIEDCFKRGVSEDGIGKSENDDFVFAVPKTPSARQATKTPSTRGSIRSSRGSTRGARRPTSRGRAVRRLKQSTSSDESSSSSDSD